MTERATTAEQWTQPAPAEPLPADAFEELPLLRFMSRDVRRVVVSSFTRARYEFGDVIVRQGDVADALYVLVSGRARVLARAEDGSEVTLGHLGPGDSFGEDGLAATGVRTATVRASSRIEAGRLDGAIFRALVATNARIADAVTLAMRRHALADFLSLRTEFADLPPASLAGLLDAFTEIAAEAGETIVREGEAPGPLYVVKEGRLRVERGGRPVAFLVAGDHFGERSLFTGEPRSATVTATTQARLLALSPDVFQSLLVTHSELRAKIARRVEQYDYRDRARVPADVDAELLPAGAEIPAAQVGDEQVEVVAGDDAAGDPPFATPDGRFVKRPRRLRRFPLVRQVDEADCGAACLAMICRHHGRRIGLARLRELSRTGVDGASLQGLADAADALGLAVRRVKASKRNVEQLPLPAILHWDGNHWVVLYDVDARRARIADPAAGHQRVERAELEERWTGYAALLEPTQAFGSARDEGADHRWLWSLLRPQRRLLAFALLLALAVAALQMTVPGVTQVAVDHVIPAGDVGLLHLLVLALAGVMVATVVGGFWQRLLLAAVAMRVDRAAMVGVSARLLALPMRYFYARRTGDIARRIGGMQQIRRVAVQDGVLAITSATQLAAALAFMVAYSPALTAFYAATVPLYAALIRFAQHRLRPLNDALEEAYARHASQQVDAIQGIETVKAAGAEDALRRRMVGEFEGLAQRAYLVDRATLLYEGAVQVVSLLSLAVFVWAGVLQVLGGALSVGGLVAFNALVVLANAPVRTLLGLYDDLQFVSMLLERLSDVFETEPEQGHDRTHLADVPSLAGHIRLSGVTFRYGGPSAPRILDGITLDVPPGTTVAVVGRSGSGKTTLVKLLAGLIEPTEGQLTYDGLELGGLDYRQLRRQIGLVLQETHLFSDTVAANIAFGDDEADRARVEWAARVANAHEFVARLPLGYETKIGETGLLLSGGQRQRIAIARAVYHRPAVLLLDEATSALDSESERAVQANMGRLLAGRTSFVIAHRLSTVRHADLIVVLDRGRIVERGTHDDLMTSHGLYYYLCSQQLDL